VNWEGDYFRGVANAETDWVHAELERQRLGLTDLILWESQGVRDHIAAKAVERQLLTLEVFDMYGADLAREAARNYRTRRICRRRIDADASPPPESTHPLTRVDSDL
jgi:hypothetical protein